MEIAEIDPLADADFEVAVEIVGGVEAAAEPEDDSAAVKEKAADKAEDEESEPAEPKSASESILTDLDFDPSDERYAEKAAELFLEPEELANVVKQIADLDAEDFRLRNEASKRLAMVEAPVEHLLGAARKGAGIEMSRRIQGILNVRVKQRRLDALYHAAERITASGEPGFVSGLLAMSSTFSPDRHWDLLRMFELAAAKSSREQDRAALEAALKGDKQAARELAAFVLGHRFAKKPAEGSRPEIPAGDDEIRLAHSRGRVAAGDRAAGSVLVELLGSDVLRVRHEAGLLLRKMHAKDFGFAAYDEPGRREAAAGSWKNYIGSAPGDQAATPVLLGIGARGSFSVLVGKKPGKQGAVLSFTTSGKQIGDHPLAAAMRGNNPNRIAFDDAAGLIVASGGALDDGRVTVFSNEGGELWSISGLPAGAGCAPKAGGRLLVAIGDEVEEVEVTGNRVGVWKLGTEVASFGRMREGRYLCAHPKRGSIAEYGEEGELLWQHSGFHEPTRVDRLPNGNLLIVAKVGEPLAEGEDDANRLDQGLELLEASPDGKKIVARVQPKGVKRITCAARLPNGNTLIGTEKGLAEYTPEGYAIKVWLKTAISSLHVR